MSAGHRPSRHSIPPFPDKKQETEYEMWRANMILQLYGPQPPYNPLGWRPNYVPQRRR